MDYAELAESLKYYATHVPNLSASFCAHLWQAADAIEQLLRAAKKMHLWIFLNSGDEQAAYDWCGLSDEMNAALGYGGQFEIRAEPPETLYYPQVDGVTPMVVVPKEETE